MNVLFSYLLVISLSLGTVLSGCNSSVSSQTIIAPQLKDGIEAQINLAIQRIRDKEHVSSYKDAEDFIRISSISPEARKRVTERLLEIVPECKNNRYGWKDYGVWNASVQALGEMRSLEAIDALSDCLTSGSGINPLHLESFPAAWALSQVGKPAVPRLKEIITIKPPKDEVERYMAAWVIWRIGGKEQKDFLRELSKNETNEDIINIVKFSLDQMRMD